LNYIVTTQHENQ